MNHSPKAPLLERVINRNRNWHRLCMLLEYMTVDVYSDCGRCIDVSYDGKLYTIKEGMHGIHTYMEK